MGPPSCVGFHISVCCSSSPWLSFLALCSTLSILLFSALSLLFKETGTLQPSLPLSLPLALSLSLTHTHTHTHTQKHIGTSRDSFTLTRHTHTSHTHLTHQMIS